MAGWGDRLSGVVLETLGRAPWVLCPSISSKPGVVVTTWEDGAELLVLDFTVKLRLKMKFLKGQAVACQLSAPGFHPGATETDVTPENGPGSCGEVAKSWHCPKTGLRRW